MCQLKYYQNVSVKILSKCVPNVQTLAFSLSLVEQWSVCTIWTFFFQVCFSSFSIFVGYFVIFFLLGLPMCKQPFTKIACAHFFFTFFYILQIHSPFNKQCRKSFALVLLLNYADISNISATYLTIVAQHLTMPNRLAKGKHLLGANLLSML